MYVYNKLIKYKKNIVMSIIPFTEIKIGNCSIFGRIRIRIPGSGSGPTSNYEADHWFVYMKCLRWFWDTYNKHIFPASFPERKWQLIPHYSLTLPTSTSRLPGTFPCFPQKNFFWGFPWIDSLRFHRISPTLPAENKSLEQEEE